MKKFLKENLGLMKRMGGDLKSREVVREMRSGFNMWTQSGNGDNNFYFKKTASGWPSFKEGYFFGASSILSDTSFLLWS